MDALAQRILVIGLLIVLYVGIAAWCSINGKDDFVFWMVFVPVLIFLWLSS